MKNDIYVILNNKIKMSTSNKEILKIITYLTKHNKETEIEHVLSLIKCNLVGLKYTNNSCYTDCVLLSLFSRSISFIKKEILEKSMADPTIKRVQTELFSLYNTIRNKKVSITDCSKLRRALRSCYKDGEKFYSSDTQDAGEFLQYLFSLFNVEKSPIIMIPPYEKDITLDYEGKRKFIVFYAPRLITLRKRQYYEIGIPEKINHLSLYSIIVHRNNHYTCFVKCNGKGWYYYDDLETDISFIGNFDDVLNCNHLPSVQKEGLLYFYTCNK
jgi:uncharacterized UBP type Zn finger protein